MYLQYVGGGGSLNEDGYWAFAFNIWLSHKTLVSVVYKLAVGKKGLLCLLLVLRCELIHPWRTLTFFFIINVSIYMPKNLKGDPKNEICVSLSLPLFLSLCVAVCVCDPAVL